jgi:uncharacterized ferredoxin-like protein
MARIDGVQAANESLIEIAKIGAMAALRAPRMAKSNIMAEILTGEDMLPLIEILGIVGEGNAFVWGDHIVAKKAYDAGTPIVELLIGVDATVSDLNWNCGGCGFDTCTEFNKYAKKNRSRGAFVVGPSCQWKLMDHGIALSQAAAAISAMNVENRLQADFGSISMLLGHLEGCSMVIGISLGPCGESVWYNRVDLKDSFNMADHVQFMHNTLPQLFVGFVGDGLPPFKYGPDWQQAPKYLQANESQEINDKKKDIARRIGKVVEREMAKRATKGKK